MVGDGSSLILGKNMSVYSTTLRVLRQISLYTPAKQKQEIQKLQLFLQRNSFFDTENNGFDTEQFRRFLDSVDVENAYICISNAASSVSMPDHSSLWIRRFPRNKALITQKHMQRMEDGLAEDSVFEDIEESADVENSTAAVNSTTETITPTESSEQIPKSNTPSLGRLTTHLRAQKVKQEMAGSLEHSSEIPGMPETPSDTQDVQVQDQVHPTEESPMQTTTENTVAPVPTEPVWDDSLRNLLIKRLRRPVHQHASKKHIPSSAPSRWELWNGNSGMKPLSDLPVSATVVQALEEQGISTIADLLLTAPREYSKYSTYTVSADIPEGFYVLRGVVIHKYKVKDPFLSRWVVVLEGKDSTRIKCKWITEPRGWEHWNSGMTIGVVGEITLEDGIEMVQGEPVGVDGRGSGLLPVYEIENVEDKDIRDIIAYILQHILVDVQDSLPKEIVDAAEILPLNEAIRDAHFPSNLTYKGRARLAFEEIFLYHIGKRLNSPFQAVNGYSNTIYHQGLAKLAWIENILFTDEQELVLSEIRRDLISKEPMRRILQGDVGSGKPMIALFAAISIFQTDVHNQVEQGFSRVKNSKQPEPLVLYVCDDMLSAERRYLFAERSLKTLGIPCKLLQNKPSHADVDALENGGIAFVTAEVMKSRVQSLTNIRLLIVEENEQLGQNIPHALLKRPVSPDLLLFTPTPQPLLVLETIYADFGLSIIQNKHIRFPTCSSVSSTERSVAYAEMLQKIKQGRQGYIVLPMVNGQDLIGVQKALDMASSIQTHFLPNVRIGVYCSEMRREERLKMFEEFQNQRVDVLLCTTSIEDTPTLGNATMMVVEKAELCSMMRLHRLKGHLHQSHYQASMCFIVSDSVVEEDVQKIQTVCTQHNGFDLAELFGKNMDVEGLDFSWVSEEDKAMRMKARDLAHSLLLKDLRRCRWPLLNNAVRNWWRDFDVPNTKAVVKKKYKKFRKR